MHPSWREKPLDLVDKQISAAVQATMPAFLSVCLYAYGGVGQVRYVQHLDAEVESGANQFQYPVCPIKTGCCAECSVQLADMGALNI